MTIALHGYEPAHDNQLLVNFCFERGWEPPLGHFTDFTFEADSSVNLDVAQAIAAFFAPTPAKWIEEREEKKRQELFANYDKHALMYQRLVRLGAEGAAEKLAQWDAYAEALRALNDTEDWYLNPQWPQSPGE